MENKEIIEEKEIIELYNEIVKARDNSYKWISPKDLAILLYKELGYRNCKNKVVLSREEYEKLKEENNIYKQVPYYGSDNFTAQECGALMWKAKQQGNKETAEKYFNAVVEMLKEVKQFETIDIKDLVFLHEKNKEIAKQFGFGVEE